jgi:hypothetical protein
MLRRGSRATLRQGGAVGAVASYLEAIDEINRADEELDRILECLSSSARTRPGSAAATFNGLEKSGGRPFLEPVA